MKINCKISPSEAGIFLIRQFYSLPTSIAVDFEDGAPIQLRIQPGHQAGNLKIRDFHLYRALEGSSGSSPFLLDFGAQFRTA
jgi:hypothetical protein